MLYTIKNVKENVNVVVNGKNMKFENTMKVDKDTLDSISGLIENGTILVEPIVVNRVESNFKILTVDELNILNERKSKLIDIFYKFHTRVSLTQDELLELIWFYKNVGPISELPQSIKLELDDIKQDEELIEVLINVIYPALLEIFFKS